MALSDALLFISEHSDDTQSHIELLPAENGLTSRNLTHKILGTTKYDTMGDYITDTISSMLSKQEGLGNDGFYEIDLKSVPAEWGKRIGEIKLDKSHCGIVYEKLAVVVETNDDKLRKIIWYCKLFGNQYQILSKYEIKSAEVTQLVSENNISEVALVGGFYFKRMPSHVATLDQVIKTIGG